MRRIFVLSGYWISRMIDFFYPPFRKTMSLQFFRYGVSGVANMMLDWFLYFCMYHLILNQQMLHLGVFTLSSHIAALFLTFPVTLLTGFFLQKYVTFTGSELRGKVQLFRYCLVVLANLLINYIGLKLLVDILNVYPTPSKMVITLITTLFSYFSQKKFTFKTDKAK